MSARTIINAEPFETVVADNVVVAVVYWAAYEQLRHSHAALVAALEAQEAAELYRSYRCEECMHTTRDWSCCGPCSVRFGEAIDLRRAALKAAEQPQPVKSALSDKPEPVTDAQIRTYLEG